MAKAKTSEKFEVFRENPGCYGLEHAGKGQMTSNGQIVDVSWDAENQVYWFDFKSYADWKKAED